MHHITFDESVLETGDLLIIDMLFQSRGLDAFGDINVSFITLVHTNYWPQRPNIILNIYPERYTALNQIELVVKGLPLSNHRNLLNLQWWECNKQPKEAIMNTWDVFNKYLSNNQFLQNLNLQGVQMST